MVASQIRQNARECLAGKWGKAAFITLTYFLVEFVIGFVLSLFEDVFILNFVLSIANFIIVLPLSYGLIVMFIRLKRGEDVKHFEFLNVAFSNIGRVWSVYGNLILKILPIFIIMIIASIVSFFSSAVVLLNAYTTLGTLNIISILVIFGCLIYLVPKTLSYSLSYMILFDKPELSGKEIVEESEHLMVGHRCSFVWLSLTFIGWIFLAAFTFGVGYLWLFPYMLISQVCFYENLTNLIRTTPSSKNDDSVDNGPIQEI